MQNNECFRHLILGFAPYYSYQVGYCDQWGNWLPVVVSGYYKNINHCRDDAGAEERKVKRVYERRERQKLIARNYGGAA